MEEEEEIKDSMLKTTYTRQLYYTVQPGTDFKEMKDTPTLDGDVTDRQAKSMLLTGPQDPLPNLVVKRDVGDLFQDLSQPVNGNAEEFTASQRSLLGAFDGVSDLSNDAAIILSEEHLFTRRTRSSTRLQHAIKSEPIISQIQVENQYYVKDGGQFIQEEVFFQDADPYGMNAWPHFYVGIPEQKKTSKNVDYLVLEKTLFTKIDVDVPFELTYPQEYANHNTMLRIFVQYDEPTMKGQPVERCPNHVNKDHSDYRKNHFVQTEDRSGLEYGDGALMYDLRMPLTDNINLKFKCWTSCSIIKRRPISLVFEISGPNLPSLTYFFCLRSCANPSRDAQKEIKEKAALDPQPGTSTVEKRHSKQPDPTPSPTSGESKFRKRSAKLECNVPIKRSESEDGVHTIMVYGRSKYYKVLEFIESLEKTERYNANKFGEPNLFNDLTQITYDTRVQSWLDGIALGRFAENLQEAGIRTMGDLCETFTPDLFEKAGISKETAGYLNKVFLNWRNVYENHSHDDQK
ncbi:unnamed protein product, partial [Mesorhabditis belari]|uniref:P53 DNA-binding domain-containing protein n=1 Tax=Mesorhabditis belari TaxID=2138241 RepID=A0AAF3F6S9_9BILA